MGLATQADKRVLVGATELTQDGNLNGQNIHKDENEKHKCVLLEYDMDALCSF